MKTVNNLKKSTMVGMIVFSVLCLLVLAISVTALIQDTALPLILHDSVRVIMLLLLFVYAFCGYKTPHGNMLKAVMLAFCVYLVFFATLIITSLNVYAAADCILLASLIIAYVSGRLDRLKANCTLLTVAGLLLAAAAVLSVITLAAQGESLDLFSANGTFATVVIFATLAFSYVARYDQHKNAGLEEK